jgi:CheY-like chemotaxis protein
LRTPLNAILGWVQLLQLKKDEASLRRGLDTIERNARLQAQLIEDLLDMSRIVSGHVRLELELIDPALVVENALEAVRPAAFSRQVTLEARLERPLPRIWADPTRLQQVMWNLLSNAIKFTPSGGRVEVVLRAVDGGLEATVADTGAGIPADFLPHVFDRFRQADASTTRRYSGLGLGLAIVRELVQLHGGTVEADSAGEGKGALFTVRLPAGAVAAPAAADKRLPAAEAGMAPIAFQPTDLSGMKVLVVDDEPDARQLLEQILLACGARVQLAADAEQALELLRGDRPDVLVSDIGMPNTDGFELIRRVRAQADADLSRVPAVALTAFTRRDDERRALREGFDRYLPKPVDATALVAELARTVRPRVNPGMSLDPAP